MTTVIRILGIILLIGGVVIFCFGLNSSQSVGERGMEKVTGRYTEGTMKYLIGGLVMVISGIAVALNANRIYKNR